VRLRPLDTLDDGSTLALLTVEEPVPVRMGDRFVLREVGRRSIVAGGRVLEPAAPRKRRDIVSGADRLATALGGTPDERAEALLVYRGSSDRSALRAHSGGGTPSGGITAGSLVMLTDHVTHLASRAVGLVETFHADNPLRPGLPKASLASQLGVDFDAIGAVLALAPALEERGSAVASSGFSASLDTDNESEWERIRTALIESGLSVPRLKELEIDRELLHVLLREERLVKISDELLYLPEQLDEFVTQLGSLPSEFTVAELRDAFELTRKYAVPLIEWLDRQRITTRDGDTRWLA
jgi:selenocysteine-specific elongation factor